MSLETATYIHQLNAANPASADRLMQGDDHIRMLKAAIKATFPNITGPVNLTQGFLNGLVGLLVPIGSIMLFGGATAPDGWAICNGQTVPKSDGSGNITVPDLRGRVAVGASVAGDIGATTGQTSKTVTSASSGAHGHGAATAAAGAHSHGGSTQAVGLTEAQLPAHRHFTMSSSSSSFGAGAVEANNTPARITENGNSGSAYLGGVSGTANVGQSSPVGSGQTHGHGINGDGDHSHVVAVEAAAAHSHSVTIDVTQPSYALHYIIKV